MNIISNRWHYNALTGNSDVENDTIIGVYDFLSDMTSSNGPFAVRWNAAGILNQAQA